MKHEYHDQRSLDLHRRVAAKMRQDPSLLPRAISILDRWRSIASPRTMPYYNEWHRLLHSGLEEVLCFAVEESERATAHRQASPLSCLLTPKERIQFLREWKENNKGIQTSGITLPLDTEKMSEWQQTSIVRKPLS
jgi:hypothetical protein